MKKMFLILNHNLTQDQKKDAQHTFGVTQFISMPQDLAGIWESIPPDTEVIKTFIDPFLHWLTANGNCGDIVLVQGDYGATFLIVEYCLNNGFVPVYATSRRIVEERMEKGYIKTVRKFVHVRFRLYGK